LTVSGRRDKEDHPSPDPREVMVFEGFTAARNVDRVRSIYNGVCDNGSGSIGCAGRELWAFVVVLKEETAFEVEAFTNWARYLGYYVDRLFPFPTRLKAFRVEMKKSATARKRGIAIF
jgi:hypothetical protein